MMNSNLIDARRRLLGVKDLRGATLDPLAVRARAKTAEKFKFGFPQPPADDEEAAAAELEARSRSRKVRRAKALRAPVADKTITEQLLDEIRRRGIGAQLLQLTTSMNKSAADEVTRTLLATDFVLDSILFRLIVEQEAEPKDIEGLRAAVLAEVGDIPKSIFLEELADAFVAAQGISLPSDSTNYERFLAELRRSPLSLQKDKLVRSLQRILETVRKTGSLSEFVDRFADRGEVDKTRFTADVRASMVSYLEAIGLSDIPLADFNDGKYDEYFAAAYHHALFGAAGAIGLPPAGAPPPSAFDIYSFSFLSEPDVVRENLTAAAKLYFIYVMGDVLGLFDVANALLLRRARGRLDLGTTAAAQRLHAYKRYLKSTAIDPEDRYLLYKRVFNEGPGEMLEDSFWYEDFPADRDAVLEEVGNFWTKEESNSSNLPDKISRANIEEAMRHLQHNLSYFASDISDDVDELEQQLRMVDALLNEPAIAAAIGGTHGNKWRAVAGVLNQDLGRNVDMPGLLALAETGYKFLDYAAHFDGTTTTDDTFRAFLDNARKYIIALGKLAPAGSEPDEEEEVEDKEEMEEEEV